MSTKSGEIQLQRSKIINDALREYFGCQKELLSDIEDIKKGIEEIKQLLKGEPRLNKS